MPVTHVLKNEAGFIVSDPWATDTMPVKQNHSAEIFDEFFPKLHKTGTLFRYVPTPADSLTKQFIPDKLGQPHPLMHQTDTLD